MHRIQLTQLSAFAAVAEHRNFTRAARHLGITTPSLSQAIRCLEEKFGVRLLNRTTRSVTLTEAGEQLVGHLAPLFEGVDRAVDAVNAFRDKPAGTLRLLVHPVAVPVFAPLVVRFSAEYPAIHLDVAVDGERRDIVAERFDAGIHLADGLAQDMITVPVGGRFRLTTVAAPEYLACHTPPSSPEDLRRHNCVRYRWTAKASGDSWKFRCGNRQVDVVVEASLAVNDQGLALGAALDGVGIAQLPDIWVSRPIAEGRLVELLAEYALPAAACCLFYPSRRHVPVKLRAFIDFLRREAEHVVPFRPRDASRRGLHAPAAARDELESAANLPLAKAALSTHADTLFTRAGP